MVKNEIVEGNCACVPVCFWVGDIEVAVTVGWSSVMDRKKGKSQYGVRQRQGHC